MYLSKEIIFIIINLFPNRFFNFKISKTLLVFIPNLTQVWGKYGFENVNALKAEILKIENI